ncbi:hypothetical protein EC988_000482 [Linderina pennispora]|nr:hypothetical protein EC988_000482 [Linderina pennispora]
MLRLDDSTKYRSNYSTASWVSEREGEIMQLAQSPDTLPRAIDLYRKVVPKLPLNSRTPWMLLSQCHDLKDTHSMEWMTKSLRVLRASSIQSVEELMLCAYMHLGQDDRLREAVFGLCLRPAQIGSVTMTALLTELQGCRADRQLACNLWVALLELPNFAPSQTNVQLAMKIALHTGKVDIAVNTYQKVLSRQWTGVRPGYWAERVMVYGLAINGMANEAFEVAAATTNVEELAKEPLALQTAQKYELLLRGLSKIRFVDEAVAVFEYVRNDLGLWPTLSMYSSLLGLLAARGDWATVEKYLNLMEDDGHVIPHTAWKRILLGFAKQGQIEVCDKILATMAARNIPYTYIVVSAALEAFTRTGNYEMVLRWYSVVHEALVAQAKKSGIEQQAVNIDDTTTHGGMGTRGSGHSESCAQGNSLQHPEQFIDGFIERNELVWHRNVLVCVLEAIGELGDQTALLRVWEDIYMFQERVRTLTMSPFVFMALARALARTGALVQYEDVVYAWIDEERNGFSYSQRQEAIAFVRECMASRNFAMRGARRETGVAKDSPQAAGEPVDGLEHPSMDSASVTATSADARSSTHV